jgi:hypothetical protein
MERQPYATKVVYDDLIGQLASGRDVRFAVAPRL